MTRLAGGLAVTAVGGSAYRELAGPAWMFVAVGSALGIVQLLLYAQLAWTARTPRSRSGWWSRPRPCWSRRSRTTR